MEEKRRVLEIRRTYEREIEEKKETIIIDYDEKLQEWIYLAPNAQKHTVEQLEEIINLLKKMNVEHP